LFNNLSPCSIVLIFPLFVVMLQLLEHALVKVVFLVFEYESTVIVAQQPHFALLLHDLLCITQTDRLPASPTADQIVMALAQLYVPDLLIIQPSFPIHLANAFFFVAHKLSRSIFSHSQFQILFVNFNDLINVAIIFVSDNFIFITHFERKLVFQILHLQVIIFILTMIPFCSSVDNISELESRVLASFDFACWVDDECGVVGVDQNGVALVLLHHDSAVLELEHSVIALLEVLVHLGFEYVA